MLIIDDEPVVLRVTELSLLHAGFRSLTSLTLAKGLELFRAHRRGLDAVLLDATLPGMDLSETLADVRGLQPDLPVLVTSGYGIHELGLVDASGAPLEPFLQKPYTPQELVQALAEQIGAARVNGCESRSSTP